MKLYLFRHGLAMDRQVAVDQKMDDSLRPLVEKGRDRTKKVCKSLREHLPPINLLVSSPLVRAQETADIISDNVACTRYLESSELVPEAPPQAFARWLKSEASQATAVMAVGHEPQLSSFASWVLSGDDESFIDLKKSGVICLEVESFESVGPGSALLKWVLNPKFL